MKRIRRFWIPAIAAAAFAGCKSTEEASRAGASSAAPVAVIEGIVWTLSDVGGAPATPGPQEGRRPFILLQNGQLTGSSGVNSMTGAYHIDGIALRFGPIAMTRRAGSPQAMGQEAALSNVFNLTTSYRRSGSTLLFLDPEGRELATFRTAQDPR